jgi:TrmH family RNA methyltransferase
VILVGDTTDPYDPGAVRASLGAIFSQRLVRASLDELAAWKLAHQVAMVGTSGAAPTDYQAVSYAPPLVLLMGGEQRGLSQRQQALCDLMVSIPMVARSDSLNLAVATAVVLYEMLGQRRGVRGRGLPVHADPTHEGRRPVPSPPGRGLG